MPYSARLAHVNSLFCTAESQRFRGVNLSATGVGESPVKAERRCNAELAEAKAFVLGPRDCFSGTLFELKKFDRLLHPDVCHRHIRPAGCLLTKAVECTITKEIHSGAQLTIPTGFFFGSGRPASMMSEGMAAGINPEMALRNAVFEAIERYASSDWWFGGRRGKRPSVAAARCFDTLQQRWERKVPRRTGLLDISPDFDIPVFVAWSCRNDGRGLCFGTASRPTETAAIRAAFRELLQMEFGLDVARYRQQHEFKSVRRERTVLARASQLGVHNCEALLTPQSTANRSKHEEGSGSLTLLAKRLARFGKRFYRIDLTRPDEDHWVVKVFSPDLRVFHGCRTENMAICAAKHNISPKMPWMGWDLY